MNFFFLGSTLVQCSSIEGFSCSLFSIILPVCSLIIFFKIIFMVSCSLWKAAGDMGRHNILVCVSSANELPQVYNWEDERTTVYCHITCKWAYGTSRTHGSHCEWLSPKKLILEPPIWSVN